MSQEINTTTGNTEQLEATPSDFQQLFDEQIAENERLKAIIAASRLTPVTDHPQKDARPAVSASRLKALLGQHQLNQMTRAEKLAGLQIDPASADDDLLKRCFGRGNTGEAASELFKTSPLRYRQLKNAAEILNIYCN